MPPTATYLAPVHYQHRTLSIDLLPLKKLSEALCVGLCVSSSTGMTHKKFRGKKPKKELTLQIFLRWGMRAGDAKQNVSHWEIGITQERCRWIVACTQKIIIDGRDRF